MFFGSFFIGESNITGQSLIDLISNDHVAALRGSSQQDNGGNTRIACGNHWRDHSAFAVADQRDASGINFFPFAKEVDLRANIVGEVGAC